MTLPPRTVAGTGLLTGPVQKPAGSGAAARATETARTPSASPSRYRPRRGTPSGARYIEAVIEGRVAAVLSDDLHLPLLARHEPESDDRVGAERDVGVHMEHLATVVGRIDRADEACRGVKASELVHLHAVEIRMADHELRLQRLAGVEWTQQPQLHPTDVLQG